MSSSWLQNKFSLHSLWYSEMCITNAEPTWPEWNWNWNHTTSTNILHKIFSRNLPWEWVESVALADIHIQGYISIHNIIIGCFYKNALETIKMLVKKNEESFTGGAQFISSPVYANIKHSHKLYFWIEIAEKFYHTKELQGAYKWFLSG